MITLRSFLKYLEKTGIKSLSPTSIDLVKQEQRQVEFLNDEELYKLVDDLYEQGVPAFAITGGEPFLEFENMCKMIRYSENKLDMDGIKWHKTGDVGYIDDNNEFWLLGKKKGIINKNITDYALEYIVSITILIALFMQESISRISMYHRK